MRHAAIICVAESNCGSDCRDERGPVGENAPMKVEERSVTGGEMWMFDGDGVDEGGGVGEGERGRLGGMWGIMGWRGLGREMRGN